MHWYPCGQRADGASAGRGDNPSEGVLDILGGPADQDLVDTHRSPPAGRLRVPPQPGTAVQAHSHLGGLPAARATPVKPASRASVSPGARTYTCTTSRPVRSPVLATLRRTANDPEPPSVLMSVAWA